jgi:hypothetical protein
MTYSKSVGVSCSRCGTQLIVLPGTLYKAIGDLGGVEAELEFAEVVVGNSAKTGDVLTIGDVHGGYTCPNCEARGQLPSDDELYRLEAEQHPPGA